jgi:hypothetical protein
MPRTIELAMLIISRRWGIGGCIPLENGSARVIADG